MRAVTTFVGRYLFASVAAWVVFVLEGVLLYAALLVVAVATDAGAGGPLAGPFLVAAAAALGLPLTGLVCAPAVALGELTRRDGRRPARTAAALGTAALLLALAVAAAAPVADLSVAEAGSTWLAALLAVLPPTAVLMTIAHGSGRLLTPAGSLGGR